MPQPDLPITETNALASCGDGIVAPTEACDDGNQDDTDECLATCKAASCGDAVVQVVEECDDRNEVNTDDCVDDCSKARCGDGVTHAGKEACDDGNVAYMAQFGACCSNSIFYVS